MTEPDGIRAAIEWLAEESAELWVPRHLPVLAGPPSPLTFLREHVLMSTPCLVRGAMDGPEWAGARGDGWSLEALSERMGSAPITVNVTPDGHGDAVVADGRFVKPEERTMTFAAFARALRSDAAEAGVHYLSLQDDNLRAQHAPLATDVPASVDWFGAAVGGPPDAINLWIGDSRAVSSVHSDHYENLYCVLSGEKVFTLLPPTDPICADFAPRKPARYAQGADGRWRIDDDAASDSADLAPPVEWIGIDPADPAAQARLPGSCALTVRVGPGEMLYLPANWYHRVTQSAVTVAVNYWHDPIQSAVPPAQLLAQFARKVQRAYALANMT
jgi:jumonji domain-containing protein 7